MTAWIVRAGLVGERDNWALQGNQAGGGFQEVADLTGINDRAAMKALVDAAYPGEKPGKIANFTGQLWALSVTIKPGDLIVLPLKTTKKIAVGVCTSGYKYRADEAPDRRHTIGVDWKVTDIPRLALKDDLLNTVNGAMTIFQASKRDAAARLQTVVDTGTDPGFGGSNVKKPGKIKTVSNGTDTDTLDTETADPVPAITLEAIRDRVRTYLVENFGQHKLTGLVAEILRAQGYICDVSPAGPDFGVDILAGRGPLGLDSPTVVVEVKSEQGQIGVPVLNQLQGAVKNNQADQGLLVAWGGLNKQAETLRMSQRLKVRVWNDEDVIDQLLEVYDRLPEDIRVGIPLKRAWVLLEETG
jgi:restriction system protein